jgi:hypothetical protein
MRLALVARSKAEIRGAYTPSCRTRHGYAHHLLHAVAGLLRSHSEGCDDDELQNVLHRGCQCNPDRRRAWQHFIYDGAHILRCPGYAVHAGLDCGGPLTSQNAVRRISENKVNGFLSSTVQKASSCMILNSVPAASTTRFGTSQSIVIAGLESGAPSSEGWGRLRNGAQLRIQKTCNATGEPRGRSLTG